MKDACTTGCAETAALAIVSVAALPSGRIAWCAAEIAARQCAIRARIIAFPKLVGVRWTRKLIVALASSILEIIYFIVVTLSRGRSIDVLDITVSFYVTDNRQQTTHGLRSRKKSNIHRGRARAETVKHIPRKHQSQAAEAARAPLGNKNITGTHLQEKKVGFVVVIVHDIVVFPLQLVAPEGVQVVAANAAVQAGG